MRPVGCFQQRRRVCFAECRNEIFQVPCRNEQSWKERIACALTQEEFEQIKAREKNLSRQLSQNGFINDPGQDDSLGLETKQDKTRRKQRVLDAQMFVLVEQALQWENQDSESEFLAAIYTDYSRESAILARNRGLTNKAQVEHIMRSDLQEMKSRMAFEETSNDFESPHSPFSRDETMQIGSSYPVISWIRNDNQIKSTESWASMSSNRFYPEAHPSPQPKGDWMHINIQDKLNSEEMKEEAMAFSTLGRWGSQEMSTPTSARHPHPWEQWDQYTRRNA